MKASNSGALLTKANHSFEEIHIFDNVAQPTGNRVDRSIIRQRRGACRSITELTAKWRRFGDGYYYLIASAWPVDTPSLDLRKPW